jgi:amidohydrolase
VTAASVATKSVELRERAYAAIDQHRNTIISISDEILANPELGFFEHRTSRLVSNMFSRFGIQHETGLARTGVKARLTGRRSVATLAVIGELDALILPDHPTATAEGIAHACGHNAQIAALIGVGVGLGSVMGQLDGDVVLFATPAEECIDLTRREELRGQGEIGYLTGKAELIRLGAFDDVDLAVVTHTANGASQTELAAVGATYNGAILKEVVFHGRAAHPGAAPHLGVDAMKAAAVAAVALDAQRATFRDQETVRINHVIRDGGVALSVVPATATMQAMLRARTVPGMRDAGAKFDRAVRAGALALGCRVEISTAVAYFPQTTDPGLLQVAFEGFAAALGKGNVSERSFNHAASTDMGDLSLLMPVVQPRIGGVVGNPHTVEYRVEDHDVAVIGAAKGMVAMAISLLETGAVRAKAVLQAHDGSIGASDYVGLRREFEGTETADYLTR